MNIKIALQYRMERGDLDEAGRLELLSSMTDEVADLVLADNTGQNRVLGASRLHAPVMLSVHARLIDAMVDSGRLDRALEFLPSHAQIDARTGGRRGAGRAGAERPAGVRQGRPCRRPCWPATARRPGLRGPAAELLPAADARRFAAAAAAITAHPLAREIVTTEVVNEMVNRAGITYAFRLEEEMAASPEDAIRAYTMALRCSVCDAVSRRSPRWTELPAETQDTLISAGPPAAGPGRPLAAHPTPPAPGRGRRDRPLRSRSPN